MGQKNIGMCLLLTVLTCGLYIFYWMYSISEEALLAPNNEWHTSGFMVLVFDMFTCGLYGIYWCYKMSKIFSSGNSDTKPLILLLLWLCGFGWVSLCVIQDDINQLNRMKYN
ncbi:MAG: hypothetical protein ATN33_00450 [Epulopiscium sp. Nele67-Bin001]|nr:MAG: hypothetical protein ATN33_00450 [Epulopiscium sp. Nele67-Bin001]